MIGKILFWAVVIIAALICIPLVNIWCVNVLFPTAAIPYTLKTWFAAALLFSGSDGLAYRASR